MKREKTKTGPRLPALEGDLVDFLAEQRDNIPIDEHNLVEMQKIQTGAYHEVSERLVLETSRKDAAKQFFTLVKARVEDAIRADVKESGEKVTEAGVASRIALNTEVIDAENELLDAERGVRELTALKDSFQQRSHMLRDMAQLWIAGYYSDAATESADRAVRGLKAGEAKRAIAASKTRRNDD